MKPFTILSMLLTLTFLTSNGQVVKLEIQNPFPRIGDEFEITYEILKDTFEVSEAQNIEDQMKEIRAKKLGNGSFKFTKLISDTGNNTFGPFIFNINNKTIESNIVKLQFDNPLPKKTSGIWIRQLFYLGQEYLIIEQRISGEWVNTSKSANSISREFKQDNDEYVEIDKTKINKDHIEFDFSFSTSKSQDVEINDKTETVGYKVSLYKISRKSQLKKSFKLDKSNLKFLPEKQSDFEFTVN